METAITRANHPEPDCPAGVVAMLLVVFGISGRAHDAMITEESLEWPADMTAREPPRSRTKFPDVDPRPFAPDLNLEYP